jgi:hypothetical protein
MPVVDIFKGGFAVGSVQRTLLKVEYYKQLFVEML